MKILDYKVEALKYIIPYFRQNEDIVEILRTIGVRFNGLQDAILKILYSQNLREARGIWLDNYGAEVGASRDELDFGDYFCVNRAHINAAKKFYFTTSKENPLLPLTLGDAEFIQKIIAYIGGNKSNGTWNEIIDITKTITDAERVFLKRIKPGVLAMNIQGKNILLTRNTVTYIQGIVSDGIYLEEIKANEQAA